MQISAPRFQGRVLVRCDDLPKEDGNDAVDVVAENQGALPGIETGGVKPGSGQQSLESILGSKWQPGPLYRNATTRSGDPRFAQVDTEPGLGIAEEIKADIEAAHELSKRGIPFAIIPSQMDDFGPANDSTLRDKDLLEKAIAQRKPVAWNPNATTDQNVVRGRLNITG